jgi:hypothetical protein
MITVNPHEERFTAFNALPSINSKFKTPFQGMVIKKTLGRDYPKNAGNTIVID